MLTDILTFLSENKVITIGAVATICEVIVIVVNCVKRIKAVKPMSETSKFKTFLWVANPINLFKEV